MAGLLFDENLSPLLVGMLAADFPGSTHVRDCGLASAEDADVWRFASEKGLTIVSKDGDFHQMSLLYGAPPKVVWVRAGNCSTAQILTHLRRNRAAILEFADHTEGALLVIGAAATDDEWLRPDGLR